MKTAQNVDIGKLPEMELKKMALRENMKAENDAIVSYDKYINLMPEGDEVRAGLEDIRDEEKKHLGELTALMGKVDPAEDNYFFEGKKEVTANAEDFDNCHDAYNAMMRVYMRARTGSAVAKSIHDVMHGIAMIGESVETGEPYYTDMKKQAAALEWEDKSVTPALPVLWAHDDFNSFSVTAIGMPITRWVADVYDMDWTSEKYTQIIDRQEFSTEEEAKMFCENYGNRTAQEQYDETYETYTTMDDFIVQWLLPQLGDYVEDYDVDAIANEITDGVDDGIVLDEKYRDNIDALNDVFQKYDFTAKTHKGAKMRNKKHIASKKVAENAADIIDNLVDTVNMEVNEGNSKEDAVRQSIDDHLIYDDDILELAQYYGVVDIPGLSDMFYDSLYDDLMDKTASKTATKKQSSLEWDNGNNLGDYTVYSELPPYKRGDGLHFVVEVENPPYDGSTTYINLGLVDDSLDGESIDGIEVPTRPGTMMDAVMKLKARAERLAF